MKKIAIVQPIINQYRQEFLLKLMNHFKIDFFNYLNNDQSSQNMLNISKKFAPANLKSISIRGFLIYDILPILNNKYEYLVIIGNIKHLSAWMLLIAGRVLKIKVILWGHGISMARYLNETKKLPIIRLLMYRLAFGAWFYTRVELQLYRKIIRNLTATNLNNTISEVEEIINIKTLDKTSKQNIKGKYNITTKYNLLICTQFESPLRKTNELKEVIDKVNDKWGLIVIGDGKFKPNFSQSENVYDFGSVYDRNMKNELFRVADLYIQLGHVGLSVVEAFAYRLPIITLKRSNITHHSVEYNYIINEYNGLICDSIEDVVAKLTLLERPTLLYWGNNARQYVTDNLQMSKMVQKASSILK